MRGRFARGLMLGGWLAALAACDHTGPFSPHQRQPVGPLPPLTGNSFVTRLTFNPGDDRNPSVHGDTLVFSRFERIRSDRDRCIAFQPIDGGTIFRMECANGGREDFTLNAWLSPTVSPDGSRIAYVAEESNARLALNQPSVRRLLVAPLDSLDNVIPFNPGAIRITRGSINDFRHVGWIDSSTVRFIGGTGGFNSLTRDTIFTPLGLFDWEINTGRVTIVPGIFDPVGYTVAPDGGVWFVRAADSSTIYHLPVGSATPVPLQFDWSGVSLVPGIIWDIDNFDGLPVVAARIEVPGGDTPPDNANIPETHVLVLHPGTAIADNMWVGERPRNVTKIPGRPAVVAEIQQANGANLFILRLP